jgi:hypothetical protein
MSWTKGAHMIKFGGQYRWSKSDRLTNNRVDPQFIFNGNRSDNALGDFFLGYRCASIASATSGPTSTFRTTGRSARI